MKIVPMLLMFELVCGALFFTTFCRMVKLDRTALLRARLAYMLLGIAVLACMYFAAFQGYMPSGPDVLLATAFTIVQVVSSRGWKIRYPEHLSSGPAPFDDEPQEKLHAAHHSV